MKIRGLFLGFIILIACPLIAAYSYNLYDRLYFEPGDHGAQAGIANLLYGGFGVPWGILIAIALSHMLKRKANFLKLAFIVSTAYILILVISTIVEQGLWGVILLGTLLSAGISIGVIFNPGEMLSPFVQSFFLLVPFMISLLIVYLFSEPRTNKIKLIGTTVLIAVVLFITCLLFYNFYIETLKPKILDKDSAIQGLKFTKGTEILSGRAPFSAVVEVKINRDQEIQGKKYPAGYSIMFYLGEVTNAGPYYDYKKARAIYGKPKLSDGDFQSVADKLIDLQQIYRAQGKTKEEEATLKRTLELYEKEEGSDSIWVANRLSHLGNFYLEHDRYNEAEPIYKRALAIYEKNAPEYESNLMICLEDMAALYKCMGNEAEAKKCKERAEELRSKVDTKGGSF